MTFLLVAFFTLATPPPLQEVYRSGRRGSKVIYKTPSLSPNAVNLWHHLLSILKQRAILHHIAMW